MNDYEEKLLRLSDGRDLAYSHCGNVESHTIVVFFHGMFGIGAVGKHTLTASLVKHDVHYIAPTLPGWGNSSSVPHGVGYHIDIAKSMTELLRALGVDEKDERVRLYIGGGSFGSVATQMLYGASHDVFPFGGRIRGCLLAAPLSPFGRHKEYSEKMGRGTSIFLWMCKYIPYDLVPRMAKMGMEGGMKTYEGAQKMIGRIFEQMDAGEKAELREWERQSGRSEGEFERDMTVNAMKSVGKTWDGFVGVPRVLHSEWGVRDGRDGKGMVIVSSKGDEMAPIEMAEWLHGEYAGSTLKVLEGGHLAVVYHLDLIWDSVIAD